ncbi:MAG TPA: DUF3500 domain-containing protein [Myxococcaceae bacterium]|nr:DUF3500 domain-containing protein [Myxococcaceae bacterium]
MTAPSSRPPSGADAEMSAAASRFLAALRPEQRSQAQLRLDDRERTNWHFVPRSRKGLPFKSMSPEQRQLAERLVAAGLSRRGYDTALTIIGLETVLAETDGPMRDVELYYLTIFGDPGAHQPWGWRFEGHHLSLNFTSPVTALPAVTPSFFGSNPNERRRGGGVVERVLAPEEDLARELVKSLDVGQRKLAILSSSAPADILNGPGRKLTSPEGIGYGQLGELQQALLVRLIKVYLDRYRPDVAAEEWARIERAGLENIRFAWAGGLEPRQGHYYRTQGRSFILEYDNTQNDANHVHTVWRDAERDFGVDLLREHYLQSHRDAGR